MKKQIIATFAILATSNAYSNEFVYNGNFNKPVEITTCNAFNAAPHTRNPEGPFVLKYINSSSSSVEWGSNYGVNNGPGLKFHLPKGGSRAEIFASEFMGYKNSYCDGTQNSFVDIGKGQSRWNAFSFKLDSQLTQGKPLIIHQRYSAPSNGPKIHFYLSKVSGINYVNFAYLANCRDNNWDSLINADGDKLCPRQTSSKVTVAFDKVPFTIGKWNHIRYNIRADWPTNSQYQEEVASGSLSAAIKQEGENWQMFWYRGLNNKGGKRPTFSTFTHDISDHLGGKVRPDGKVSQSLEFGIYGLTGLDTTLYIDEIHSNRYFSALPAIYR